jgi:hypothetical protein
MFPVFGEVMQKHTIVSVTKIESIGDLKFALKEQKELNPIPGMKLVVHCRNGGLYIDTVKMEEVKKPLTGLGVGEYFYSANFGSEVLDIVGAMKVSNPMSGELRRIRIGASDYIHVKVMPSRIDSYTSAIDDVRKQLLSLDPDKYAISDMEVALNKNQCGIRKALTSTAGCYVFFAHRTLVGQSARTLVAVVSPSQEISFGFKMMLALGNLPIEHVMDYASDFFQLYGYPELGESAFGPIIKVGERLSTVDNELEALASSMCDSLVYPQVGATPKVDPKTHSFVTDKVKDVNALFALVLCNRDGEWDLFGVASGHTIGGGLLMGLLEENVPSPKYLIAGMLEDIVGGDTNTTYRLVGRGSSDV